MEHAQGILYVLEGTGKDAIEDCRHGIMNGVFEDDGHDAAFGVAEDFEVVEFFHPGFSYFERSAGPRDVFEDCDRGLLSAWC